MSNNNVAVEIQEMKKKKDMVEDNGQCVAEERPLSAKVFEESLPVNLRGKRPKEMNSE